jgi:hypothetical protein
MFQDISIQQVQDRLQWPKIMWPVINLTLILPTWTIWWAPSNTRKWEMGFNSALKGLTIVVERFIN